MKLVYRIVMLIVLLIAVLAVMQKLTPTTISSLLGDDLRPYNWCPAGANQIEVYKDGGIQIIQNPDFLPSVCEIMIGSFNMNTHLVFTPLFAVSIDGKGKVQIEKANRPGLFRVKDLPFASTQLEKTLDRLDLLPRKQ